MIWRLSGKNIKLFCCTLEKLYGVKEKVRPKKFFGQHFLHNQQVAQRIVDSLVLEEEMKVLEIGPGMGVLTRYLVSKPGIHLKAIEIDRDSVAYLHRNYPGLEVIEGDVLDWNPVQEFTGPFNIIGNFPYNISSQIFFRVLEYRHQVKQVVCMLQKEVADRLVASHGSKTYGILSVLLQAFYKAEYLFKVSPGVFMPPPKVMSAVIRLSRNNREQLGCDESLFFAVVKQAFNTRRKTLRNALKNLSLPALQSEGASVFWNDPLLDKRAEQLSVEEFIQLTLKVEELRGRVGSI
jgi:16S rRNA (adenine1518-N6/adenine1519-N6)-dimethyltransferase